MPKECPQALLDALAPKYAVDKLREAYKELYTLYEEGTLFSEDDYEQFPGKWYRLRSKPCAYTLPMTAICAANTALRQKGTSAMAAS